MLAGVFVGDVCPICLNSYKVETGLGDLAALDAAHLETYYVPAYEKVDYLGMRVCHASHHGIHLYTIGHLMAVNRATRLEDAKLHLNAYLHNGAGDPDRAHSDFYHLHIAEDKDRAVDMVERWPEDRAEVGYTHSDDTREAVPETHMG